jgi:hypothetical protein
LVELAQVGLSSCPQSRCALTLESDRCTFGVVLVVPVGILRGGDDLVELAVQSV